MVSMYGSSLPNALRSCATAWVTTSSPGKRVRPHGFQQGLAADDLAGVADQHQQQVDRLEADAMRRATGRAEAGVISRAATSTMLSPTRTRWEGNVCNMLWCCLGIARQNRVNESWQDSRSTSPAPLAAGHAGNGEGLAPFPLPCRACRSRPAAPAVLLELLVVGHVEESSSDLVGRIDAVGEGGDRDRRVAVEGIVHAEGDLARSTARSRTPSGRGRWRWGCCSPGARRNRRAAGPDRRRRGR